MKISKTVIIIIIITCTAFLGFMVFILAGMRSKRVEIQNLNIKESAVSQEELERREARQELEVEKEEAQKNVNIEIGKDLSEEGKISHETRSEISDFVNEYYKKEQELLSEKEKEDQLKREELRKKIYEEVNKK